MFLKIHSLTYKTYTFKNQLKKFLDIYNLISGSAFPITLRLRLVFLDAYHMGSANAHCVASLLVSKATASAVGCFQSFFTSFEFLDIPAMGSANAHCVASLLVSKATASAVGCFQSFFTSFEFLDIPAMGSANAHCVASLLVSKATAST